MFLAGDKKDFLSTGEYMSVLCAAVVVSVQERVGYLEGRDGEEVQRRQKSFHFPQPIPLCTDDGQTCGSYFLSELNTQ